MTERDNRVLKPIEHCEDQRVTKFELVSSDEVDNYLIEFKLYDKYTGRPLYFKDGEGNKSEFFVRRLIIGEETESLNKLKPDSEYVELEIDSREHRDLLRSKSIEVLSSITKGSTIISMGELSVEDGVYSHIIEANLDSKEISTLSDDIYGELEIVK